MMFLWRKFLHSKALTSLLTVAVPLALTLMWWNSSVGEQPCAELVEIDSPVAGVDVSRREVTEPTAGTTETTEATTTVSTKSPMEVERDIQAALKRLDENLADEKRQMKRLVDGSESHWNLTERKHILLVTTWRSGSTFLSQQLASHPTAFFHYEPLWHVGVKQIRSGQPALRQLTHLKNLLQCKFLNQHYNYAVAYALRGFYHYNLQTWKACPDSLHQECVTPSFLERACDRFPTIVAKIVRLRLNLTRQLLEDPQFRRLKVIYLIRDPRATWNSRKQSGWCVGQPECIKPSVLCDDLLSDLDAYQNLSRSFSDRLMFVKFEDLASEPLKTFQSIFQFADLPLLPSIVDSIRNHTSRHVDGETSTFRKSANRISQWKEKLRPEKIASIQSACKPVLERLGYPLV